MKRMIQNGATEDDHRRATSKGPGDSQSAPASEFMECYTFDSNKYGTQGTLANLIDNDFCPQIGSEGLQQVYLKGTSGEVLIAIDGTPTPSVEDCKSNLHKLLNECDIRKLLNWAAGGTLHAAGGQIKYRLDPHAIR